MKMLMPILAGIALLMTATAVNAATVSAVNGAALVNAGEGFVILSAGTVLEPGAQISVPPQGSVKLIYNDGTEIVIGAGRIYTVSDTLSLAANAQAAVPAVVVGAEAVVTPTAAAPAGAAPSVFTPAMIAAGAVGVAAASAAIASAVQQAEEQPVSP
jgi:hypothetical protein